jgi:outer membrane protein TolC
LFFFGTSASASDTLSLNHAISIALENNYSISLAENNLRLSEIANNIGNAGMLPTLALTGARTLAVNNSKQIYFDGRLREGKNAKTNSKNAGLQLTWTIFDGMNMFIQKDKLNELQNLSAIQLRSVVENTVSAIINTYYNIVSQQALAEIYREAMKNSAERYRFAKSGYDLGRNSEFAVLQASVDLNADSASYIRQLSFIENLKADLNLLLCRDLETDFDLETKIPVNQSIQYEMLKQKMQNESPELQKARKDLELARIAVKEMKTLQLPRLNVNSGYSFNQSNSEVGIMTLNRNYGYNVGLSLSYNIFDGFSTRQQISQARIRQETAKTNADKLNLEYSATLQQVYNDYATNLKLISFETANLELAKRNYRIAEERYKLGSLTDIELRETQVKTMEAENRLLTSLYRCKMAETELFRLAGVLSVENQLK